LFFRKRNFEKRIEYLEKKVAVLTRQNEELTRQNAGLVKQNKLLIEQNRLLTEKVAQLSKNSSNSSKPPSSDITNPPKGKGKRKGGKRKRGGQKGHPGQNRVPITPDQVDKTVELPPDPCQCGHNHDSSPDREKTHYKIELRLSPIIIIAYKQLGYACKKCGKVVWGKLPEDVIPNQLFGPRLQALIGYMKGRLHASYSSLEDFCHEILGVRVSRAHLCNVVKRINESLATPYEELKEHIPTEPVLNIDESGWKDQGDKYWIWVFGTVLVSFFCIAKSRSSRVLNEILGQTYHGTMISDFFGAYVKYASGPQQFCLAHLIRDIKFLTTLPGKSHQSFGHDLLMQFRGLFVSWHLKDKIPKKSFRRSLKIRRNKILKIAGRKRLTGKSATLAKRFQKHGEAIFRFIFDPAVPPTNNEAERSMRQVVIDRKITQGSRSEFGRQWNARIWTVLDTCRKQGRSPWQFLQDSLFAYYFHTDYPTLVPSDPLGA